MGPCMARRGSLRQGRVECVISGVDMTSEPGGIRQNDSMQALGSSGPPGQILSLIPFLFTYVSDSNSDSLLSSLPELVPHSLHS